MEVGIWDVATRVLRNVGLVDRSESGSLETDVVEIDFKNDLMMLDKVYVSSCVRVERIKLHLDVVDKNIGIWFNKKNVFII